MKVSISKESKKWMTIAELPIAKAIVAQMKEDETEDFYASYALAIACDSTNDSGLGWEILSAKAEICRNDRAWNRYTDDSAHLDVHCTVRAVSLHAYYEVNYCLSDIWDYDGDNTREIKSRMYIRRFLDTAVRG